jgi:hypothetical protein
MNKRGDLLVYEPDQTCGFQEPLPEAVVLEKKSLAAKPNGGPDSSESGTKSRF